MDYTKQDTSSLASLPAELRTQVEDVAKNFAIALKNSSAGTAVDIPDWISIKAQNWIIGHTDEFSAYVILQYRRIMKGDERQRPSFILPDPEKAQASSLAGSR